MAARNSASATRPARAANEILTQILSHVGELSDALSPSASIGSAGQGTSTRNTGNTINQTVEEEVRKVFGRSERPSNTLNTAEGGVIENPEEHPALYNAEYVPDEVANEVAIRAEAAITDVEVAEVAECTITNTVQQDPVDWACDEISTGTDDHLLEDAPALVKEIAIHRSNVLKDMIAAFKEEEVLNCALEIVFIDNQGKIEEGRGSGVKREAFSLFWSEFYDSLTLGVSEKVPAIRHDYQMTEWQSVGRILFVGYSKFSYFPIGLSKAFIASCFFTEELLPNEWLLDSFHRYIAADESETLKKCLTPECGDLGKNQDLLDFLSAYKCYRVVSKENMPTIIDELAHQELIQRPKYIANAWIPIVNKLKQHPEFTSIESLHALYEAKKPSNKKVCNLLRANPSTDAERECLSHLKRFIKSLDHAMLRLFLQFITGSDTLAVEKVDVGFNEEIGFSRRPTAHTCGPLLVIPANYQSYNELSEEFSSILRRHGEWSFHIVDFQRVKD
ncbi:uncharacterized protein LOC114532040 [Dendronephthya gigantea]|uniref:uncharacterized protein LOC114532040 n=1 Tax=Dendronephthya gigantea TaxID=151771 RepID=UPI00106A8406|nr:uncharacterized protein LOC114532040 [Dendronephthya gigantea]